MNRRTLVQSLVAAFVFPLVHDAPVEASVPIKTFSIYEYAWTYNRGDEAIIYPDRPVYVGETIRIEGFDTPLMRVTAFDPNGYGGGYLVESVRS